jgi:hypothetical protein
MVLGCAVIGALCRRVSFCDLHEIDLCGGSQVMVAKIWVASYLLEEHCGCTTHCIECNIPIPL